jgi:dihydropteroate synthase
MKIYFCFRNRKIPLVENTYIMGILNITPDSFSDGGKNFSPSDAVSSAIEMESLGSDFIDIGGQSTRPGSEVISAEQEWQRLEKVLPEVLKSVKSPVSVDTFYPVVAERALKMGCHIINDVSGTVSKEMAEVVRKYNAGWVLMHKGEETQEDICLAVHKTLLNMISTATEYGIKKENICLDPGIGFDKTMEQNRLLIKETEKVRVEGIGYLLGASRKRIIDHPQQNKTEAQNRDFGTVAAHTIGIFGGADIIRVHNCFGAIQGARISDFILRGAKND